MKQLINFKKTLLTVFTLSLLASCSKFDLPDIFHPKPSVNNPKVTFYALAEGTKLVKINSAEPTKILNSAAIFGLQPNETILAIDFRPATGQLYGLGSTNRLYVLSPDYGNARAIGTAPFSPALTGTIAGFDFNPTVDRIRVVTSTGQNLRLNPETGTVAATDLPINGSEGAMVTAAAYTNNVAGATTTVLYDIDITSDKLFKQDPPNNGTLVEVGNLNLNVTGEGGFDISPEGVALAVFAGNNKTSLFTIDLATGKAGVLYKYSKDMQYTGIAIPTAPVAYAVSTTNNLLIFNPQMPAALVSRPITGIAAGENILGIDFRPLNGQLYALGSTSRLYSINASSGAATAIGAPFTTPLAGTSFGFDFNPMVDRIRVISNTGQNLRLHPDLGTVAGVDMMLNPGTPAITAAAYTHNFAGAPVTFLFGIDTNRDEVFLVNPPNNGTVVDVLGPLGINVEEANGFDISGTNGSLYGIFTVGGVTKVYTIDFNTGAASPLADFPMMVRGFTIGLGF